MRGTLTVTIEGQTHHIPESWLVGFCSARGDLPAKTTEEGVRWWHEQWKLAHHNSKQRVIK